MLPKNRPPTHPGEMLLSEFLEPLGVDQKTFADQLGWSYARLEKVVEGRRGLSSAEALAVGNALGASPEFWRNLQRDWDLWHS